MKFLFLTFFPMLNFRCMHALGMLGNYISQKNDSKINTWYGNYFTSMILVLIHKHIYIYIYTYIYIYKYMHICGSQGRSVLFVVVLTLLAVTTRI